MKFQPKIALLFIACLTYHFCLCQSDILPATNDINGSAMAPSTQQTDSLKTQLLTDDLKSMLHLVWIKKNNEYLLSSIMYLFSASDSTITLMYPTSITEMQKGNYSVKEVAVTDIDEIHIRRKKMAGEEALLGGLSGLAIGLTIILPNEEDDSGNASSNDDSSISTRGAIIVTSVTTALGLVTGAIIGASPKQKIKINRYLKAYTLERESLRQKAIIKVPYQIQKT